MASAWEAIGSLPDRKAEAGFGESSQWQDGAFRNPQEVRSDFWGMVTAAKKRSPDTEPSEAVSVVRPLAQAFLTPPATGLRVTWMGHSTLLLEVDGLRILTDPIWGERTSPVTWAGPKRFFEPPLAFEDLPPLDAVLISHDHYDHLDMPTIKALNERGVAFYVPLGVGSHLAYWGVPWERIHEMDWWESTKIGEVELVCAPARHASGRFNPQSNQTLWSGWAIRGPQHRVYFSGDTGLFPALTEIGEKLGPFDLTLFESGAYNQAWPDWHLGPEQAVRAHQMVRGEVLIPVHWGLFNLAMHAWTEPAERVLAEAERVGAQVIVPRPGQMVEPGLHPALERWWPTVPWVRGVDDPIVASQVD